MNDLMPKGRILVMTAVEAEREAVLRGLNGNQRFDVQLAGVGAPSAAARTAAALASGPYSLVISAGIGGGFPDAAPLEALVIATSIVAADLGAETPGGFSSVEELGFGSNRIEVDASRVNRLIQSLQAADIVVCSGPILTVSTATGTATTASRLADRIPGATAEAMEGYGVAVAAHALGLPVLELRTISNAVGPRDRDAWKIPQALHTLKTTFSILPEVL